MNAPVRRRSTALLACVAFVAALLPLAAVTAYFIRREHQLADEVAALERRLRELDAQLAPTGHLDRLRGEALARKGLVDVLREPQRGLQAAVALTAQIPAGTRLVALDVDGTRLSVQVAGTDAAASAPWLERLGRDGFSDAMAAPAGSDGTVTLTARIDPARFAAAASRTTTP